MGSNPTHVRIASLLVGGAALAVMAAILETTLDSIETAGMMQG